MDMPGFIYTIVTACVGFLLLYSLLCALFGKESVDKITSFISNKIGKITSLARLAINCFYMILVYKLLVVGQRAVFQGVAILNQTMATLNAATANADVSFLGGGSVGDPVQILRSVLGF